MSVGKAGSVLSEGYTRLHRPEQTMQSSLLQSGRCQLAHLLAGAIQGPCTTAGTVCALQTSSECLDHI